MTPRQSLSPNPNHSLNQNLSLNPNQNLSLNQNQNLSLNRNPSHLSQRVPQQPGRQEQVDPVAALEPQQAHRAPNCLVCSSEGATGPFFVIKGFGLNGGNRCRQ